MGIETGGRWGVQKCGEVREYRRYERRRCLGNVNAKGNDPYKRRTAREQTTREEYEVQSRGHRGRTPSEKTETTGP